MGYFLISYASEDKQPVAHPMLHSITSRSDRAPKPIVAFQKSIEG
jgi:hypothetical protein